MGQKECPDRTILGRSEASGIAGKMKCEEESRLQRVFFGWIRRDSKGPAENPRR